MVSSSLSLSTVGPGHYNGVSVWQVLFHVLNHGTDHRAQLLAMVAQFEAPTFDQDYALYVRGKLR